MTIVIYHMKVIGDPAKSNFSGVVGVNDWRGFKRNKRKVSGDSKYTPFFLGILLQMERKRNGTGANKGLRKVLLSLLFLNGKNINMPL